MFAAIMERTPRKNRCLGWLADLLLYLFGFSAWWWVVAGVVLVVAGYRRIGQPELETDHPLSLVCVNTWKCGELVLTDAGIYGLRDALRANARDKIRVPPLPMPAEPYRISPGRALARAMKSFVVCTGIEGCTASMPTSRATGVIPMKSFSGS